MHIRSLLLGSLAMAGVAGIAFAPPDAEAGSIIGDKYKGLYRGASDWIGELIDERCYDTPKDKPKELNTNKLFKFAKANKIDTTKYEAQISQPNAAGRLRMTIGNMLRAAANHRHGLYDMDGKTWIDAPKAFLAKKAPAKPDQNPDGSKIVDEAAVKAKADAKAAKAKPAAAAAAPKAETKAKPAAKPKK